MYFQVAICFCNLIVFVHVSFYVLNKFLKCFAVFCLCFPCSCFPLATVPIGVVTGSSGPGFMNHLLEGQN